MSSLQVIGAGFGRTGTDSLKEALEILHKAPCYHMKEVFKNPHHIKLWQDVALGKDPQWDKIFTELGYVCAVDFPVASYWQELFAKYPLTKVILTLRPFEEWYASAHETIYRVSSINAGIFNWLPLFRRFERMVSAVIWYNPKIFNGRFGDKEEARKAYERNTADAKKLVPADQLLIFNVAEGWEPLCKFLEKPVPSTPFPRVNDKATFRRRILTLQIIGWTMTTALAGIAVAGVAYGLRRYKQI